MHSFHALGIGQLWARTAGQVAVTVAAWEGLRNVRKVAR
jgi:hypothetical protein